MNYTKEQIRTNGRRGCVACIEVYIYQGHVVASAEPNHITEKQMTKALEAEFSGYTFKVSRSRGDGLFMEGIPCTS